MNSSPTDRSDQTDLPRGDTATDAAAVETSTASAQTTRDPSADLHDPDDMHALHDMRVNYGKSTLDHQQVAADPIEQFRAWFEAVKAAKLPEPNAMVLATASPAGRPSSRVVLLKDLDARGFTFYTNYTSRKAAELDANPYASLVFFWEPLERQVRIEGTVGRVSREQSREYFDSRPVASRVGAWTSHQSRVIDSREQLEARQREIQNRFGQNVPLPDFWGGYRVVPEVVEFWQGRPSRLHDRLRYTRTAGGWTIDRLAP